MTGETLLPCFHGRTGAKAAACCGTQTAAPWRTAASRLLPRLCCPCCAAKVRDPGLCDRCVRAGFEALVLPFELAA